jgi:hypothetical protein
MKVLVFGTGIEFSHVLGLATAGHEVYYYTDYISPYPSFDDFATGYGFENIKKVHNFFFHLDKVDKVITFDVYGGDLFSYLADKGYNTFGGGLATELELNRKFLKMMLKSSGISTPKYEIVRGFKNVKPPCVVKLSLFRGSSETFFINNETEKRNYETKLRKEFGSFLDQMEFVVEEKLELDDRYVEVGIDAMYDYEKGGFLFPLMCGVEYKKGVYVGKVCNSLSEVPKPLQETLLKLDPILKKFKYKGFLSTEEFVNTRGTDHYFLDITVRSPYPLGLGYRYAIKNFADVVLNSAKPVFRDKYYVAVPLKIEEVKEFFVYVDTPNPEKDARYNFEALMKVRNEHYIPKGEGVEACVCECFSSLDEAKIMNTMEQLVKKVSAISMQDELPNLPLALQEVKKLWR